MAWIIISLPRASTARGSIFSKTPQNKFEKFLFFQSCDQILKEKTFANWVVLVHCSCTSSVVQSVFGGGKEYLLFTSISNKIVICKALSLTPPSWFWVCQTSPLIVSDLTSSWHCVVGNNDFLHVEKKPNSVEIR